MGEELEHPDWLPKDWKVNVKHRSPYGRKDKLYINPSNGLKFKSKLEVLRYLKSCSGKTCDAKELLNKSQILHIDIKRTAAENLPPGWIKEIRTKKKGYKTRRDPCYIDPVSGRHFRSMQEVYRYLQTKEDSGKPLSKFTRGKSVNSEDNLVKQREEQYDVDDGDSLAIELSDKLRLVNRVEPPVDKMKENKKVTNNYKVDKTIHGNQRLKPGSESGAVLIREIHNLEQIISNYRQHENTTCLNKRKKSSSEERAPHRASKRLARVEEEVEPSCKNKKKKKEADVTLSIGDLSCTSCSKEEDEKNGKQQIDSILMEDPCIEFAIKTLTGAIPIEEINKASLWSNSRCY